MKTLFKFACIYCGQHMECGHSLCGRQMQCPGCRHRIVIPPTPRQRATGLVLISSATWETCVPEPELEIPTRYRTRKASLPCRSRRQETRTFDGNGLQTPEQTDLQMSSATTEFSTIEQAHLKMRSCGKVSNR